jgi:L-iditol 2-dehydrogenase
VPGQPPAVGSTMRAAVFHGPGDLRISEVARPAITAGELLVRIASCAVCGSDVRTFRHGARNIDKPVVLGHELSGTIVETGAAVTRYREGQRVAVAPAIPCGDCRYCRRGAETMCEGLRSIGYQFDGGLAQFMAVPASAVRAGCVNVLPDGLSFDEAALAEPLACVINAQELLRVGDGDSVVVLGAGPIGCLHTGLARVRGAAKVILVDLRAERLQLAAAFSPDVLIDAAQEDVQARVLEETDGAGASVVIVAAPAHQAQEQSIRLAARRGRINFFGGLPKSNPMISLDANVVHYAELTIVGSYGSRPVHNRQALELVASGRLPVCRLVGLELPLERVMEGLLAVEQGRVLKVVVRP